MLFSYQKNQLYMAYFFITVLFFFGSVIGQEPVEEMDNYKIFNLLAENVVSETIDSSGILCHDKTIYVRNADPENANGWFIENWYIKSLQKMHCDSIATLNDSGAGLNQNSIVIEYKIIKLNVNYLSNDTFWKSNPVQRKFILKLWTKFSRLKNNSKIIWMGECTDSYSDYVDRKTISELQNTHISFTLAPVPEFNGYKKVLEPVFIMGISGVIIYMFYAFRSK